MENNLLERVKAFSFSVFDLVRLIRPTLITRNAISQIIRSASSIGANYSEALGACSRRDFKNKIFICKKEIHETRYWLDILAHFGPFQGLSELRQEALELNLIFNKITYTLNENDRIKKSKTS